MSEEQAPHPFCHPDKLMSGVYGPDNPPQDWADIAFLIPHEALRREMAAMSSSIHQLNNPPPPSSENWKVVYFCEWIMDSIAPAIREHHENEEVIYFPWVAERVTFPEKRLSESHDTLVADLDAIVNLCERICGRIGKQCQKELAELEVKIVSFEKEMVEHLDEEETLFPPLLRENFTQEEDDAKIQEILKKEGLTGMRIFLPMIIFAIEEWATEGFVDEFKNSIPNPPKNLFFRYMLPDHETAVVPKRDAPFLESKPRLTRVPCCKLPFCCFPCIF